MSRLATYKNRALTASDISDDPATAAAQIKVNQTQTLAVLYVSNKVLVYQLDPVRPAELVKSLEMKNEVLDAEWNPLDSHDAWLVILTKSQMFMLDTLAVSSDYSGDTTSADNDMEMVRLKFEYESVAASALAVAGLNVLVVSEDGDVTAVRNATPRRLVVQDVQRTLDYAIAATTNDSSGDSSVSESNLRFVKDLYKQARLGLGVRQQNGLVLQRPKFSPVQSGCLKVAPFWEELYGATVVDVVCIQSELVVIAYSQGYAIVGWYVDEEVVVLETLDFQDKINGITADKIVLDVGSTAEEPDVGVYVMGESATYRINLQNVLSSLAEGELENIEVFKFNAKAVGATTIYENDSCTAVLLSSNGSQKHISYKQASVLPSPSINNALKSLIQESSIATDSQIEKKHLTLLSTPFNPQIPSNLSSLLRNDLPTDRFDVNNLSSLMKFSDLANQFSTKLKQLYSVSQVIYNRVELQREELLRQLLDLSELENTLSSFQTKSDMKPRLEAVKTRQSSLTARIDKLYTQISQYRSPAQPISDAEKKWYAELDRVKRFAESDQIKTIMEQADAVVNEAKLTHKDPGNNIDSRLTGEENSNAIIDTLGTSEERVQVRHWLRREEELLEEIKAKVQTLKL